MRKINKIIIHCSATPECRDVKASTVKKWHTDKGWTDIGYHFVVELDGTIVEGRPIKKVGAHTYGYNSSSIGICYIGGMTSDMSEPLDTRTEAQKESLNVLLMYLHLVVPEASIHGHNEFKNKACPSFNVQEEYKHLKKMHDTNN